MLVVELYCLYLRGGNCLKGSVIAIKRLKNARQQDRKIYPVRILYERVKNVLYHGRVCFHTS